jgi:hypothetical protein
VQFFGNDQVSLYDAVAERDRPHDRLAYPRADALGVQSGALDHDGDPQVRQH